MFEYLVVGIVAGFFGHISGRLGHPDIRIIEQRFEDYKQRADINFTALSRTVKNVLNDAPGPQEKGYEYPKGDPGEIIKFLHGMGIETVGDLEQIATVAGIKIPKADGPDKELAEAGKGAY